MTEYICALCQETHTCNRSNEDVWKEVNEIMPESIYDEMALVCDDCYIDFMDWFKSLTTEQKEKMKKESFND